MSEKPASVGSTAWYQLPAEEVMAALAVDRAGLTSTEAKSRLAKYGHNELKFKKRGTLVRFLLQFNSPLIYVLLGGCPPNPRLHTEEEVGKMVVPKRLL